jgi:hypothetical protein
MRVIVGWACDFAHALKPNVTYLAKMWAKKHAHPTTVCHGLLRSYNFVFCHTGALNDETTGYLV